MAAAQWWVLALTEFGKAPQFQVFQATQAQAQARAKTTAEVSAQQNLFGPFKSEADAQAAVQGKNLTAPTPGGGGPLPVPPGLFTPDSGGASNPLVDLADLENFFKNLTSANTWVRFAEIVIGGVLLIMSLSSMTGAEKAAGNVAKIAGGVL